MENPYQSPQSELAVLPQESKQDVAFYPKTALLITVGTVAYVLISLAKPSHPWWLILLNSSLLVASLISSVFELRRTNRFVQYMPVFHVPLVVLTAVLISEGYPQLLRSVTTGVIRWQPILMLAYVCMVWFYAARAVRRSLAYGSRSGLAH